jgi:hypothetical protein
MVLGKGPGFSRAVDNPLCSVILRQRVLGKAKDSNEGSLHSVNAAEDAGGRVSGYTAPGRRKQKSIAELVMLTKIGARNFKAFGETPGLDLSLSGLNIFLGENNSGKTSAVDVIAMCPPGVHALLRNTGILRFAQNDNRFDLINGRCNSPGVHLPFSPPPSDGRNGFSR